MNVGPQDPQGCGATGKLWLRDTQYPPVSLQAASAVDLSDSALGGGSVQAEFSLVREAKENLERHSGAAGWSQ